MAVKEEKSTGAKGPAMRFDIEDGAFARTVRGREELDDALATRPDARQRGIVLKSRTGSYLTKKGSCESYCLVRLKLSAHLSCSDAKYGRSQPGHCQRQKQHVQFLLQTADCCGLVVAWKPWLSEMVEVEERYEKGKSGWGLDDK